VSAPSAARWREHAAHFRQSEKYYTAELETARDPFWLGWYAKALTEARETAELAERFAAEAEQRESKNARAA
jgi:hypothetical protein